MHSAVKSQFRQLLMGILAVTVLMGIAIPQVATALPPVTSAPDAPSNVHWKELGGGAYRVSWTAPTNNGGSAITSYAVKATGVGWGIAAGQGLPNYSAGTAGSALNQLKGPFTLPSIVADSSGNLFVGDSSNCRVTKWTPGATTGILVAGTGTCISGTTGSTSQLGTVTGVALAPNGDLYIADKGGYGTRVIQWRPGASSGTVVVQPASGTGWANNQIGIASIYDISTAPNGDLLLNDYAHNRIMRWVPGASSGTVIAGAANPQVYPSQGGSDLNQLHNPISAVMDSSSNLYIADSYNDRVLKIAPGESSGTVLPGLTQCSGGSGCQFVASLAVDGSDKLWVSYGNGKRIYRYDPSTDTTTTAYLGTVNGGDVGFMQNAAIEVVGDNIYVADFSKVWQHGSAMNLGSCTYTVPSVGVSANTCDFSGLTPATSYSFTVSATNAIGSSVDSSAGNVASTINPGPPTSLSLKAGDRRIQVQWLPPINDGGSAVTSYTAIASPGGATCTSTLFSCSLTGLTAGSTYSVTATATNAVGTSVPSASQSTSLAAVATPALWGVQAENATESISGIVQSPDATSLYTVAVPGIGALNNGTVNHAYNPFNWYLRKSNASTPSTVARYFQLPTVNAYNARPYASVAVSRDGSKVAVSSYYNTYNCSWWYWCYWTYTGTSARTLQVFNTTTGAQIFSTTTTVAVNNGNQISFNGDGTRVILGGLAQSTTDASNFQNLPTGGPGITVFNAATGAVTNTISGLKSASAVTNSTDRVGSLVLSPDGNKLYVGVSGGGSMAVSSIATADWSIASNALASDATDEPVGSPGSMVLSADGSSLYTNGGNSNRILKIATSNGSISASASSPVNQLAEGSGSAKLGLSIKQIALSSTGTNLYVLDGNDDRAMTAKVDILSASYLSSVGEIILPWRFNVSNLLVNPSGAAVSVMTNAGLTTMSNQSVPAAPANATAWGLNTAVEIAWDVSGPTGSIPDFYTVTASPSGKTCSYKVRTTPGGYTNRGDCVIEGLANGTQYSFTIAGTNSAGTGSSSSAVLATPADARATTGGVTDQSPRNISVWRGDRRLHVSWDAASNLSNQAAGYTATAWTVSGAWSVGGFENSNGDPVLTAVGASDPLAMTNGRGVATDRYGNLYVANSTLGIVEVSKDSSAPWSADTNTTRDGHYWTTSKQVMATWGVAQAVAVNANGDIGAVTTYSSGAAAKFEFEARTNGVLDASSYFKFNLPNANIKSITAGPNGTWYGTDGTAIYAITVNVANRTGSYTSVATPSYASAAVKQLAIDSFGNIYYAQGGKIWQMASTGVSTWSSSIEIPFSSGTGDGVSIDAANNVYTTVNYNGSSAASLASGKILAMRPSTGNGTFGSELNFPGSVDASAQLVVHANLERPDRQTAAWDLGASYLPSGLDVFQGTDGAATIFQSEAWGTCTSAAAGSSSGDCWIYPRQRVYHPGLPVLPGSNSKYGTVADPGTNYVVSVTPWTNGGAGRSAAVNINPWEYPSPVTNFSAVYSGAPASSDWLASGWQASNPASGEPGNINSGSPLFGTFVGPSAGKSVTVTWAPSSDNGGTPIQTYGAFVMVGTNADPRSNFYAPDGREPRLDGQTPVCEFAAGQASYSCTFHHLVDGQTYSFFVSANNGDGYHFFRYDDPLYVMTPLHKPMSPPTLTLQPEVNGIIVEPHAPIDNGGAWFDPGNAGNAFVWYYDIKVSQNGTVVDSCRTSSQYPSNGSDRDMRCEFTGLTPGLKYSFTATATNPFFGPSPASSSVKAMPFAVPLVPKNPVAHLVNTETLHATWSAPSNDSFTKRSGNQAGIYYQVSVSDGQSCETTKLSCDFTITDPNANYDFAVVTLNQRWGWNLGDLQVGTYGDWSGRSNSVSPIGNPDQPYNLGVAQSGNGALTVSWAWPSSNGGSPFKYAIIQASNGKICRAKPFKTSCRFSKLTLGSNYDFNVRVYNVANYSNDSWVSGTPYGAPMAPRITSTSVDNGSVTVTVAYPSINGGLGINSVKIVALDALGNEMGSCYVYGDGSNCTITGLTNGQTYALKAQADNGSYLSRWSAPKRVTPNSAPADPAGLNLTAGNHRISATWGDNGDPSTVTYRITAYMDGGNPKGKRCRYSISNGLSVNCSGLRNGRLYTITVQSLNAKKLASGGISASATPGNVPLRTAPPRGNGSETSIDWTWNAPQGTGGLPIDGYTVKIYDVAGNQLSQQDVSSNLTNVTITGLQPKVGYRATVTSRNAIGSGPQSKKSATVYTGARPSAPQLDTVYGGYRTATAVWQSSTDTGGLPLLGYRAFALDLNGNLLGSCKTGTSGHSCTIRGIANYQNVMVHVVAFNRVGDSEITAGGPILPFGAIAKVSGIHFQHGPRKSGQMTTSWTAPDVHGDTPVTSYVVIFDDVANVATEETCTVMASPGLSADTSCDISGLVPKTQYKVKIVASTIGASSVSLARFVKVF